eukprot:891691-Pyramimonas_sp.AAC.1
MASYECGGRMRGGGGAGPEGEETRKRWPRGPGTTLRAIFSVTWIPWTFGDLGARRKRSGCLGT